MVRKFIFILLFFLVAPSLMAQSPERIIPTDTLIPPTITFLKSPPTITGDFVTRVTDDNDFDYVYAEVAGAVVRYEFADNTGIPADATISHIIVLWRGQDTGNGNNRQRIRLRMDGNANFCDGANVALTISWVDYEDTFTQAPSTGGTCGNSWTKERVDSVNVQLTCTSVAAEMQIQITELDMDVYYTEVGGVIQRRRRMLIGEKSDEDKIYKEWVELVNYNSDPIVSISYNYLWSKIK